MLQAYTFQLNIKEVKPKICEKFTEYKLTKIHI